MAYKKHRSLQSIEDYYYRKGLRDARLRTATSGDREYWQILKNRWSKLAAKIPVKAEDKRRYVLSTDEDYKILDAIYALERRKLSNSDEMAVKLI